MIRKAVLCLIWIYQQVSKHLFIAKVCRFYPSCSEYTRQAVVKYGVVRGGLKGMRRLSRCHPFNPSCGYDPLK
ncbi:MAG: membrane protein insertion efficiency factor YidD [Candidatus Omnitrophica bacterium]|nr:membrane protein insertion efficiency factor YidD [Candidatus Omnitrophota bacterium]MDD5654533.1 membrane protein insertion efficiency factor YidD [Candidatus Omnitrophota bacterium]